MTFSREPGLASLLFRISRSRDARAAAVEAAALRLTCASGPVEIPLGAIDSAELKTGWRWGRVRVRHASGEAAVSGLRRADAEALAAALEAARVDWWRRELASRSGELRSVHERLGQFEDPPEYVGRNLCLGLERAARELAGHFPGQWPDTLPDAPEAGMLAALRGFLHSPDALRARANETYVAGELKRCGAFFDRVEGRPLTDEQRRAVVVDEDRNLVVAAAGSGKTSVIVAKAGWLVLRGFRRPSELLLLAFARDARDELDERIRRRLGDEAASGATVRTFHSLGMSIIGKAEGKRPSLARAAEDDRALIDLLKKILAGLLADGEVSRALSTWFMDQFAPYRSDHEFRNWGEYWDYLRRFDIRSLKGEVVRSMEECEIANFLYLNGVPYEYEAPYEHDTAAPEKRQYRPDFHLPEAGIYIEHFGLDAEGRTARFVDEKKYLREMEWKRRLHKEKGTVLIETFSRERAAGALTRNLGEKLAAHGVTLSPLPPAEVFAVLQRQGRIDPFMRLLATFLHHFKGAQLSFEELSRRAAGAGDPQRAEAFLAVFRPVFERYRETLSDLGQIDFHDMIDKATEHVEAGRYRSPFGYILVDEFQDISPARARLLKALLDQSPAARLFAVGDDWQAIFRFAGSDIAVMRDFGKRFGASERIDLETTFRCPEAIAAAATRFVLANPAQIRKKVRSTRQVDGPGVHVGLAGAQGLSLLREALDRIAADAAGAPGGIERAVAGTLPAFAAARPVRPGKPVPASGADLHDRTRLQGTRSRLCGGPRPVLGEAWLSGGDRRRPASRSRPCRAGRASKRRGAASSLRRHDPGQTPGFPSRRRGPPFSVRPGADREEPRRRRLRAFAGEGSALPEVRRRTPGATRELPQQERLLRLLELAVLPAQAAVLSCLRRGIAGRGERRVPLQGLPAADRGLP